MAHMITLYASEEDMYGNIHELEFNLPYEWLKNNLTKHDMSIDDFLNEYTSDESLEIYAEALLEGIID